MLEVGSGGYNAALLAELVGAGGQVTTVGIDADVTRRARQCLDAAGYQQVRVVTGDAEHGVAEHAPYDRIVVTVRAWDIPPAWRNQLARSGRMVVPLHVAAITHSIAFDRTGDTLTSRSYRLAHFVPMQGEGGHPDHLTSLGSGVALRSDAPLPGIDAPALGAALHAPRGEFWSGAAFDMPDELDLFLFTSDPGMAMLHASDEAISQGLVGPRRAGWVCPRWPAAAVSPGTSNATARRRARVGSSPGWPRAARMPRPWPPTTWACCAGGRPATGTATPPPSPTHQPTAALPCRQDGMQTNGTGLSWARDQVPDPRSDAQRAVSHRVPLTRMIPLLIPCGWDVFSPSV